MKEITEALDAWMTSEFGNYSLKLWGYAELMEKDDQVMPVTIPGRLQVAIDDVYQINTWMRWSTSGQLQDEIEGNNWSFGLQRAKVQNNTIRFILVHKISIGEDFIISFLKDLPNTLDVDGYSIVSINTPGITVDADHESVHNGELDETNYEKHRFDWNMYAINIPIEFIPCTITSP